MGLPKGRTNNPFGRKATLTFFRNVLLPLDRRRYDILSSICKKKGLTRPALLRIMIDNLSIITTSSPEDGKQNKPVTTNNPPPIIPKLIRITTPIALNDTTLFDDKDPTVKLVTQSLEKILDVCIPDASSINP